MGNKKNGSMPTDNNSESENPVQSALYEFRAAWHAGERADNLADLYLKNNGGSSPNFKCEESMNDGYVTHAPVGIFLPNAFGLHNVHGNVCAWCQDVYTSHYANTPVDGSANKGFCPSICVIRRGSWHGLASSCRSVCRTWHDGGVRVQNLGLRPAADISFRKQ